MSGILDNKSRIMDTIVTLEGRRQMAEGKLRIEYVSFTDNAAFYDPDVVSGSADATNRLYFEQCQLPQDQIVFEADDSGKIKPFNSVNNIKISAGQIYQSNNFSNEVTFLTGSEFASSSEKLLASSIANFKNLQILNTRDFVFENEGFKIGPSNIEFFLNDDFPIKVSDWKRNLNGFPSIFYDKDFSHSKNFKYLPPINKIDNLALDKTSEAIINKNKIGNYQDFRESKNRNYDFASLKKDLSNVASNGFIKSISFDPTSLSNRIVSQVFEIDEAEMKKLDVVEFGTYLDDGVSKQVFFIGKVLTDDFGCQTFLKIFTLVFE